MRNVYRNFTFSPPFTASIDYVGHNSIDISQRLTGVALALAQLRNFQIKLKALHFNRGFVVFLCQFTITRNRMKY